MHHPGLRHGHRSITATHSGTCAQDHRIQPRPVEQRNSVRYSDSDTTLLDRISFHCACCTVQYSTDYYGCKSHQETDGGLIGLILPAWRHHDTQFCYLKLSYNLSLGLILNSVVLGAEYRTAACDRLPLSLRASLSAHWLASSPPGSRPEMMRA
ncbi:hypothetical protein O181_030761 [Austropuccinia psidii MF-1]|uniref:Uncharacterized protein n=1 Tax=Austropuccinia psidii MF-1 TaxID=1389203 RepID=A0A9Q3CZ43_9BASI|nr:hypothetical protein [Austropuccinia psidii MF-1]